MVAFFFHMFYLFTLISVNVPPEILSWSIERRKQFVESMNKGSVSEYNGRGIVIGTADTEKINLFEKLRRNSNLRTESTGGIRIYSHEFLLDAKECTIIGNKLNTLSLLVTLLKGKEEMNDIRCIKKCKRENE